MDDIVTRLRDPDYVGALQHLRSWDEIDRLFNAAADLIMSLRADVDRSNEVEETTHGLYKFWNAKAQELAASNDALRSDISRLTKERDEARRAGMEEAARIADESADGRRWQKSAAGAQNDRRAARDFETMMLEAVQIAAAIRQKADIPASDDLPEEGSEA